MAATATPTMPTSVQTNGRFNRMVVGLLDGPVHRLLSRWFCVVRYTGRKSGQRFATPTQYVRLGDDVIIVVGAASTKTWWRNFVGRSHPIDVLVDRQWRQLIGRAVVGADSPEETTRLLTHYLERFPRAERAIPGTTTAERVANAVLVHAVEP